MSSVPNKRQQARNERTLQDLIRTVPGNDRCADCQARNPGWASWSLGIFLCMRCAGLHRKLGTHISKVKSLSMDTWSIEQVEIMKRTGNVTSNQRFNPSNVKPFIPIDVDEVESAMEKYIRQKYELKVFTGEHGQASLRQNTGNSSSDDQPPPLPPKPGKKFSFGLRSSSSTFSKRNADPRPTSPDDLGSFRRPISPALSNKPSRVFGASVSNGQSMDSKLATLKDMGFPDESRNATVLKGLGGDIDRAAETLARLGESARKAPSPSPTFPGGLGGWGAPAPARSGGTTPAEQSSNPFDRLDAQDQMAGSTPFGLNPFQTSQQQPNSGVAVPGAPYQTPSYNPFTALGQPAPGFSSLGQPLQNFQAGQPGYPASGGHMVGSAQPQQSTYSPYTAPPMQNGQAFASQAAPATPNPFLRASQSNVNLRDGFNPGFTSTPSSFQNAPMYQQPATSPPPQMQQQYYQQPYQQSYFQGQQSSSYGNNPTNPYYLNSPVQPMLPQQTGRTDKASIMALYNHPQLAPVRSTGSISQQMPSGAVGAGSEISATPFTQPSFAQHNSSNGIESVPGSQNPFLSQPRPFAAGNPSQIAGPSRHVSQESVDFAGFSTSGRHSPDAFASLSSRYLR